MKMVCFQKKAESNSVYRKKTGLKLALKILVNIMLVALVGLASAVAVVPRIAGAVPLTVLSGSMTPTIAPGDVVVVRPTPVDHLQVGDVITFQPYSGNPTLVTHRIISIGFAADGMVESVVTQGDANNVADPHLVPQQIMGRVWYIVPAIGHLTQRSNFMLVAAGGGLLLVVYAVIQFVKKDEENDMHNTNRDKSKQDNDSTLEQIGKVTDYEVVA